MDACETLDGIAADFLLGERLVFREQIPARTPRHGELVRPLNPEMSERLAARKLDALFTHQTAAINSLRDGGHVVIATGTASGKSLCYQVPIVESVVAGTNDTALLIFPTKALAQDQLRSLRSWLVPGLRAVTYDGDTPGDDRTWARKNANVVLTNPEMLHMGILPSHQRWATFFMRLRYVVVDELHTLRGVFGSHVAHLLRRLRRVCEHYGSSPSFCFASATIGNPAQLASQLCGLPVESIDDDGSPRGERCFAVAATAARRAQRSTGVGERRDGHLAEPVRSRRSADAGLHAEPEGRRARGRAREAHSGGGSARPRRARRRVPRRVSGRRAAPTREGVELGQLLGVAATNALELGIDVGSLDAVVLNGFPGTLASLWQQVGRAGRTGRRSAAVLVAGDDQLDQWYVSHPREFFTREPEAAVINPSNPYVLRPQVSCAAHELPLRPDDDAYFGDGLDDVVRELVLDDKLKPRGGRMFWAGKDPPAPSVGTAHRVGRGVPPRRDGRRPTRRHGRRGAGISRRPRRRDLSAPGSAVPGGTARHRATARVPRRDGRRRIHATARGDGDLDHRRGPRRGQGRWVRSSGLGRGHESSHRVPAQARVEQRGDRDGGPRRAAPHPAHACACWYTVPYDALASRDGLARGR